MPEHTIDWKEASVADGKLSAPVVPAMSKSWRATAAMVTKELRAASSQWPAVRIKKGGFVMDDVDDLKPDDVRFFLEGIVQQADAGEQSGDADEADDPYAALVETYRSFGGP